MDDSFSHVLLHMCVCVFIHLERAESNWKDCKVQDEVALAEWACVVAKKWITCCFRQDDGGRGLVDDVAACWRKRRSNVEHKNSSQKPTWALITQMAKPNGHANHTHRTQPQKNKEAIDAIIVHKRSATFAYERKTDRPKEQKRLCASEFVGNWPKPERN